jgi:hypothetical protein
VGLNKLLISFCLLVVVSQQVFAQDREGAYESQTMQFSEEELPREAVMPRLDTPKAVLSRKLSYEGRWQADLAAGWLLDEAFYNNQYMAVKGSYSWDEASGVGLKYLMFGSGLSNYGQQFEGISTTPPNFGRSKGPQNGWLAFYERRMMYGKLSVSKWKIIPSFLTWDAEAGMLKYGTRQLPMIGAGLSNRFFLTQKFAAGLGIHAYLRQMVDPLSADLRNSPAPAEDDFKTTSKFSMTLDLGISYLF